MVAESGLGLDTTVLDYCGINSWLYWGKCEVGVNEGGLYCKFYLIFVCVYASTPYQLRGRCIQCSTQGVTACSICVGTCPSHIQYWYKTRPILLSEESSVCVCYIVLLCCLLLRASTAIKVLMLCSRFLRARS